MLVVVVVVGVYSENWKCCIVASNRRERQSENSFPSPCSHLFFPRFIRPVFDEITFSHRLVDSRRIDFRPEKNISHRTH